MVRTGRDWMKDNGKIKIDKDIAWKGVDWGFGWS